MMRAVYPPVHCRAARLAWTLAGILVLAGVISCNPGDDEGLEIPLPTTSNVRFAADETPDCSRDDLLSLQQARAVGSLISVDLVLTDCDGSLAVSGVAFEIAFDQSVVDFLSCDAGDLFPSAQLVPGTPACTLSGANLLGTIAIGSQQSVRVGGNGTAAVVRLNFNVTAAGVNAPAIFVNTDDLSSTAIWQIDPQTGAANRRSHIRRAGDAGLSWLDHLESRRWADHADRPWSGWHSGLSRDFSRCRKQCRAVQVLSRARRRIRGGRAMIELWAIKVGDMI